MRTPFALLKKDYANDSLKEFTLVDPITLLEAANAKRLATRLHTQLVSRA